MKTVPNVENCQEIRVVDGYLAKESRGGVADLVQSEAKDFKVMEDSKEAVDFGETLLVSLSSSPASETVAVQVLVGSDEVAEEERSACLSHGSISVIGRRRTMEDAVTVAPGLVAGDSDSYDFFAVYDGHGGAKVATTCRDRLHNLVLSEMENWTGGSARDWELLMVKCFQKMDAEVNSEVAEVESGGGSLSLKIVGSTAVVVMVGAEDIVVANCGDSRAVLCRGGVAVPLSLDHKPDRPDEKERVKAAGGRVINRKGSRIMGVLATSRSIGDNYLKPFVIPEPEVTVRARTELDNFIIIATDGLWDVVTNDVACEVVRKCFDDQIRNNFLGESNGNPSGEAAAMLAELAMARGSRDNISVIVVELSKSS